MEKLVEEAKQGNKTAFTELIISMQCELYKIAKMRLANDDDINDAIQETMIMAFKSIKKLRNNKFFKTWIIRILINECKKIYKRKKSVYLDEIDERTIFDLSSNLNEYEVINDNISFNNILKSLSPDERTILMLYYGNGFTYREIAEVFKVNENVIKQRIFRIKNKIKENIRRDKNGYIG